MSSIDINLSNNNCIGVNDNDNDNDNDNNDEYNQIYNDILDNKRPKIDNLIRKSIIQNIDYNLPDDTELQIGLVNYGFRTGYLWQHMNYPTDMTIQYIANIKAYCEKYYPHMYFYRCSQGLFITKKKSLDVELLEDDLYLGKELGMITPTNLTNLNYNYDTQYNTNILLVKGTNTESNTETNIKNFKQYIYNFISLDFDNDLENKIKNLISKMNNLINSTDEIKLFCQKFNISSFTYKTNKIYAKFDVLNRIKTNNLEPDYINEIKNTLWNNGYIIYEEDIELYIKKYNIEISFVKNNKGYKMMTYLYNDIRLTWFDKIDFDNLQHRTLIGMLYTNCIHDTTEQFYPFNHLQDKLYNKQIRLQMETLTQFIDL
jgi:hypothetical protein